MRVECMQGMDQLVNLIASRALPKQYNGSFMSGPAIAGLAQAYVDVLNKGAIPSIASTWQSVVQSECHRALDHALGVVRQAAQGAGAAVELDEVDELAAQTLKAAMEAFKQQVRFVSAFPL